MDANEQKEYDDWLLETEGLPPISTIPSPLTPKDWETKEAYLKKAAEIDKSLSEFNHIVYYLTIMRSDLKMLGFEAYRQGKANNKVSPNDRVDS